MLKTHCVTNLRASTQRCACCVLELLRRVLVLYIQYNQYIYVPVLRFGDCIPILGDCRTTLSREAEWPTLGFPMMVW